jgi:hypothetical protein
VLEPFAGKPFIERVERLPLTGGSGGSVAFRISHGAGTDTLIASVEDSSAPEPASAGGLRVTGGVGMVRVPATTERAGAAASGGWLFGGTELRGPGIRLASERGHYRGNVTGALRKADGAEVNAFLVDVGLPAGAALKGAWVIVTHGNGHAHGYEIDRVEAHQGGTKVILAADHGLRIAGDKTTEVYFPLREIQGENTFTIPLSCAVTASLAAGSGAR